MAWTLDTTYFGAMPNQAVGTLNGKPFYWRARGGGWVLRVEDQIVADGEDPEAGWWDADQCRAQLTTVLTQAEAATS